MEKITCEIIRDLLPLYQDDVCSPDSRQLVEGHLSSCPDCRRLLEKMRGEILSAGKDAEQEEEILRKMALGWKKSARRNFLRGITISLCVCLLSAGAYWGLTHWPLSVVPPNHIRAEVESTSEDYIQVRVEITDGKNVRYSTTKLEADGKLYILIKRGVIAEKYSGGENWISEFGIPKTGKTDQGESVEVKEIYIGEKSQNILIWRQGDN